jgi:RNA polymerase sigma factor (sigma-70 family)
MKVKVVHPNTDQKTQDRRIAVRKFIEQSCELAKTLPPKKKLLFLMRFDHGYTNAEIAGLCGVDEGTVCRRIKKIVAEIEEMRNCCKKDE